MARIESFFEMTADVSPHPTTVECGYQILHREIGGDLLQLSTFGSSTRQSEPKVSQTLQLDRPAAASLLTLLRQAFPGI